MDSDDERETESPSWKGVTGNLILINVFNPSNAKVAHTATCGMLREYLRSSNAHHVGVCLFGIEENNTTAMGVKGITEIFPLTAPTLDDYKKLQNIKISSCDQAKEFKISDALWYSSKMFTNCKKQLSTRSVIILTQLDVPPIEADQKPTLKRVVDLVDANIEIKIINIAQNPYEVHQFYKNFLIEVNKGKDSVLPKPIWDVKEIQKLLHQQSHRHLAVARLNFEIGDGLAIGVGVYNLLVRSSQYHKKSDLSSETNEILTKVNKTVKVSTETNPTASEPMDVDQDENEQTQMPLRKSELLFYQTYGDERVEFTDSEMKQLKNPFGPPMMKLLGFKPSVIMCKEKWFLKTGYFLFPNEGIIEGSTIAFKALHQACVETGTVAICVLSTRVNSKPNIVALSPCTHPLGLDVEVGFDVILIPFVENVRDLSNIEENDDDDRTVSEAEKNVMEDILKKLKFDYRADMFENPKVQLEYRAIEAIALEDDVEPFRDTTKPDPQPFQDLDDNLFEEIFGPFGSVAPKRAASSTKSDSSSKRTKVEIDETLLNERLRCESVNKYTVSQLKDILKHKNASEALTGLKKAELVDLVYKYCA